MVELLVGLALGLFIVATGITLLAGNLRQNRALMLESRLMQDLRSACDIITRDLRRAGFWDGAVQAVQLPAATPGIPNPYAALAPSAAASDAVSFSFSRDTSENQSLDSNEQFGFRLRGGVIQMRLGAANWQALTDANTAIIAEFSVAPTIQEIDLAAHCAVPCAAADADCPPRLLVRSLSVSISARASADPTVQRSLHSSVRLRNDTIHGACPG